MKYAQFLSWAYPGAAWTLTDTNDLDTLIWYESECGIPQPSPTDLQQKLIEFNETIGN